VLVFDLDAAVASLLLDPTSNCCDARRCRARP